MKVLLYFIVWSLCISSNQGIASDSQPPEIALEQIYPLPLNAIQISNITFPGSSAQFSRNDSLAEITQNSNTENYLVADSMASLFTWNVYGQTTPGLFKPNNRYYFKIDYEVLALASDAHFYLFLRSPTRGEPDMLWRTWNEPAGTRKVLYTETRIYDNFEDYQLKLGIKGKGKIAIRSIEIFEQTGPENLLLNERKIFDKSKAQLVWQEEFDGEQLDENKWEIVGPEPRRGGWWRKENAYLDQTGNLVLQMDKADGTFNSGAIRSNEWFKYGYFETRIKFNRSPGHWVAFWLMDQAVGTVGDTGRDGTEIDIVESPWRGKDLINHALHWDGYGDFHKKLNNPAQVVNLNEGWHTFALDWFENGYVFYVNGKESWRTYGGDVSQVPLRLFLSDEVGDWAGKPNESILPDKAHIDYIRVYRYAHEQ